MGKKEDGHIEVDHQHYAFWKTDDRSYVIQLDPIIVNPGMRKFELRRAIDEICQRIDGGIDE